MKFREGDRVRFISVDSDNAKFFRHGLENLEIRAVGSDDYRVWERDRSISWYVREEELEFFDKSQSAKIKRLLPQIETLARHPVFEIAEQAPVFLVNGRAYSVGEENSNEKDNFYEDEKRMALVEISDLSSLDGLILDRACIDMKKIGEAYVRETQKELNVLKSLDGNLDVPQLIYKQVFPYLRDEQYRDKVNELLGAEKREAVAAPEKKIKVTQSLEQIADEIGVEVKGLIEKIEKEGQEPVERTGKQSKFHRLLNSILKHEKTKPYTGSSLLGKAINGENLAIVNGSVYNLVNKGKGYKQHIQIDGRRFSLAEIKEIKREPKTDFEVGDEVLGKGSYSGRELNKIKGKIVHISDGFFGVEWEKNIEGHNCHGSAKQGHGWYVCGENLENLSEIVTENEAKAKSLEEKFLVELGKKIKIDALKEHLSRDKIIEMLKTQNEELLAIAGRKEYKEEGFGFIEYIGNYYAYIDVPSFAIKSHHDGNYYLFDKSRVGIQVRKNGADLQYGSIVMIDNIRHPLTDVDGLYQRMCLGANNLPTSGKDTGEIIAKRLKKGREIAIFGYTAISALSSHRKLGICDCGEEHYKDKIISEEKAMSLGIVIADARRKME